MKKKKMMSKIRNWVRRNFIGLNRRSLHIKDYGAKPSKPL